MTDFQTEVAVAKVVVSQNEVDHGPDHPETLNARFKLGVALRLGDDLQQAKDFFESLLLDQRRILGVDDESTISTEHYLAGVLFALGNLEDARRLQEHVLEVSSRDETDESGPVLTGLINLAITLRDLKEYKKELPLRKRIVDSYVRILDSNDPRILGARSDLAAALRNTGDFESAYLLDLELLEEQKRLPAVTQVILWAKHNIALDLRCLGREKESTELFLEVYEEAQKKLPADDPIRVGLETNRKLKRSVRRAK